MAFLQEPGIPNAENEPGPNFHLRQGFSISGNLLAEQLTIAIKGHFDRSTFDIPYPNCPIQGARNDPLTIRRHNHTFNRFSVSGESSNVG